MLAGGSASALLLIWLGYPIVVRLWAAVVPRRIRPDHEAGPSRSVSVVLATRATAAEISARVQNLLETDHPSERLQVVVALDAEGAHSTPAFLVDLPECVSVVVGDPPGGKAAALNAGVRAAKGDVLILADTAQRFDRRTIPELVANLEDTRFGAVSGALQLGGNHLSPIHWYWRLEKWLRYHEAVVHSSIGVTGAVYSVRRHLWPEIPVGTLLDDVYVPMALVLRGWRIGFVHEARAVDVRALGASAEQARKTRTMTGLFQLHALLPGVLSARNPLRWRYVMHKLVRLTTPLWLLVAVLGAIGVAVQFGMQYPHLSLVTVATGLSAALAIPPLRRMLAGGISWAFGMQVAVLRALHNGAKKRWSVWQDAGRR